MGKTYRYKNGGLILKNESERATTKDAAPESATVNPEVDAVVDEPEYEEMSRKDLYAAAQDVDPDLANWNMGRDEMLALIRGE